MVCVYLFLNYFSMLNIKRLLFVLLFLSAFLPKSIVAQKINQFDANGKRTGVWTKRYNNGNIRYSGEFIAGKEIGVFKFYKKRSNLPHIIKEFSKTSDTASVKFYNYLGKLKTQGKMIGKKRVGKWTYFFADGKKLSEEEYKNGKLDGLLVNYYPNTKKTNETYYKNGVKDGLSKTYTDDGVLIEEVNYANGKLDGPAKYYDLKGVIKEKGDYQNGKRMGKWEFYIDGEVSDKPKRRSYSKN